MLAQVMHLSVFYSRKGEGGEGSGITHSRLQNCV